MNHDSVTCERLRVGGGLRGHSAEGEAWLAKEHGYRDDSGLPRGLQRLEGAAQEDHDVAYP